MNTKFQTVDEYISTFPPKTKKFLKDMRTTIKQAAPQAEEAISYNMPAFKLDGMLVWYAGYREHIGELRQGVVPCPASFVPFASLGNTLNPQ